MRQNKQELFFHRIEKQARTELNNNEIKEPLIVAVLGHFKDLVPESIHVSTHTSFAENALPNIEVHPMNTMSGVARMHREGNVVFVPETQRREFEDAVDAMTPKKNGDFMDEESKILGMRIIKEVLKYDPALLSEFEKRKQNEFSLKDIIYYQEKGIRGVDDVLQAVSNRLLRLLRQEGRLIVPPIDTHEEDKARFILEDDWNKQEMTQEAIDTIFAEIGKISSKNIPTEQNIEIKEISLEMEPSKLPKKTFVSMKEKQAQRQKERIEKLPLPLWIKKHLI